MRGVELALDEGEASLLVLFSEGAKEVLVGVLVRREDESVSVSWLALMAFSSEAGVKELVCFLERDFWTRFEEVDREGAVDCVLSEGHAHSEAGLGQLMDGGIWGGF